MLIYLKCTDRVCSVTVSVVFTIQTHTQETIREKITGVEVMYGLMWLQDSNPMLDMIVSLWHFRTRQNKTLFFETIAFTITFINVEVVLPSKTPSALLKPYLERSFSSMFVYFFKKATWLGGTNPTTVTVLTEWEASASWTAQWFSRSQTEYNQSRKETHIAN